MSSSKSSSIVGTTRDDIAIVGMACKFPCADTPQAFWDNLVQGRSSVREIDDSRWRVADHYSPDPLAGDRSVRPDWWTASIVSMPRSSRSPRGKPR
jgi:hypothetical protein